MNDAANIRLQNIVLHIYDMDIPIKIPVEQEAYYREAGKLINDRLNQYFQNYKGLKSDREIHYFALIDIALRYVIERNTNDNSAINDILVKLTSEIEDALN